MFTRKGSFSSLRRTAVLTAVAAMALAAVQPTMAQAGSAARNGVSATTGTSDATDFSARRRGGGGAAAAAAVAGIVGTGLAIAATRDRGDYYDNGGPAYYRGNPYDSYGYYDNAPSAYYGGGPAYYNGGGYGYGNSSSGRRQGYAVPDGK